MAFFDFFLIWSHCGGELIVKKIYTAKTVNPTANIIVNKKAVASKDSELADQALLIMETMGVQVQ